jgi:hypothetical protein
MEAFGSMEVVSTVLCGKSYFLDMAKLYFTMDRLLDVLVVIL